MYFQLTRADFEALRAGQMIQFASGPGPGEQALPPDVTRGVLQSWRVLRFYKRGGSFHMSRVAEATEKFPDALPPASTPEAGARVGLHLVQSELDQFTLEGSSGCYAGGRAGERDVGNWSSTPLAIGRSPAVLKPVNGASNARLARDPALRALVTVAPPPSCRLSPADDTASKTASAPRVTSADVLAEWDVACSKAQRPHLRYLATFTPAQRLEAMSPAGLPFTRMSLTQQQQFLAFCLPGDAEGLHSLDELDGATLRVDYSLPGWYEWRPGGWFQWVLPTAEGKRVPRPPLRERTREEGEARFGASGSERQRRGPSPGLQAARRYIPPFAQPMVKAMRSLTPGVTEAQMIPQEKEIVLTTLKLQITYIPGSSHRHAIVTFHSGGDERRGTWEELGK